MSPVPWRVDAVYIQYRVEIDEFTLLTTVGKTDSGFKLDLKEEVWSKERRRRLRRANAK